MEITSQQRQLADLIQEAKGLSTYPDIVWDDPVWDITRHAKLRGHERARSTLAFVRRRVDKSHPLEPFSQPYSDFAKALLRWRASQRGVRLSEQETMLRTLRLLYEALLPMGTADPTRLQLRHFQLASESAVRIYVPWCAYVIGTKLEEIARWVTTHRITRTRMGFRNSIQHPGRGDKLDPESQRQGLKKMPSSAALEALADISNNPRDDNERVLLRIIDLLVVGGFRVGEALTLPADCWVEEAARQESGSLRLDSTTGQPILRCGIRYWPEKGGDPVVKWLPTHAVSLARRAVTELSQLCDEARRMAAVLEQNPDRVPLPGHHYDSEALITRVELVRLLGLVNAGGCAVYLRDRLGLKPAGSRPSIRNGRAVGAPEYLHRVGEIEKALLKRRASLEVLTKPNGQKQMLSESLCVMFHNQFSSQKATLRFLPELVGYCQLQLALGAHQGKGSVFSDRDLTERDGSPLKIKTHAFRHWLNTLAHHGGLTDVLLARWMGRNDLRQNAAYQHGTVEQRAGWVREGIEKGILMGPIADASRGIRDPVERREFLEAHIPVAHVTPYGWCTHNFAIEPCQFHLNCFAGCREYLRTKGNPEERLVLLEMRNFTAEQLKGAKDAADNERYGASNWLAYHQRALAGINAALEVDLEDKIADGDCVAVFPNGKKVGEPIL
ncbi:MAG: hypothetical protein AB1898_11500 [Acidobacteriota bacterium]